MNHTPEFKRSCVEKLLLSKNRNAYQVAEELGVSKSSLYKWRSEFTVDNKTIPCLAKNWSRSEKVDAIIKVNNLVEPELGRWLREKGLRSEHLKLWESEVKKLPSQKEKEELKKAKLLIKKLQKDLSKKDKALAEVSALLILKKKADIFWEEKEL
jgi:transposase-like protein